MEGATMDDKIADQVGQCPDLRRYVMALVRIVEILDVGIVVVDRAARLIYANHAASEILRCRQALQVARGLIAGCQPAATRHLRRAVQTDGGTLSLPRPDGGRPCLVQVLSWAEGSESDRGAVLVIADPESARPPSPAGIASLLRLTSAEARAVAYLAAGWRPHRIAEHLGVSITTVRTHLKSASQKTGCRRSGELISMVLRSPAAWVVGGNAEANNHQSLP